MSILLTQAGDREMFRRVYPFSPALVQTLIAVSSVLQRERTALKVMMQLLVDHRETLRVGDIVPVGDLFDVVAHGDEAFSRDMAIHFDNAKRLYHQKLLPVLEAEHGLKREELEALPYHDPRRTAFRNDDRVVKTLLLSALVPEVESLRGLTAEKLAALNHGTLKSPVSGKEASELLRRVKKWVSAGVGEIQIGEQANPSISIQLSGVDTASIIEQARREDNPGNRVRRVRQMLYEEMGITGEGELEYDQPREVVWRNTRRTCLVLLKNIRELPDSSLHNTLSDWRVVIDFPFDEPGHGPRDDVSRGQRYLQSHPGGTRTLCWIPSFFSTEAQRDLGLLVILEHVLMGERFGQYAGHLSPQDRQMARTVLENQRGVLRQRVKQHLDAAYGLDVPAGSLDTTHDLDPNEHFLSLLDGLTLQPPAAATLGGALEHLVGQALEHDYPGAPLFETEVRPAVLKKVYELILPAVEAPDGRVTIERTQRPLLRQVANPLRVGEMGPDATVFLLTKEWREHFTRRQAATGAPFEVANLRRWIDDPKPMGLSREAQNLIILLFARQTNRTFYLHNGPYPEPSLQSIPDACELRNVELPAEEVWQGAVRRAHGLFGLPSSRLLSVTNVETLSRDVRQLAAEKRAGCQQYVQQLRERMTRTGLDADQTNRLRTAVAAQRLVEQLQQVEPGGVIAALAGAVFATTEAAVGECVARGAELSRCLEQADWANFDLLKDVREPHAEAANEILGALRQLLASDEHVEPLVTGLETVRAKATRLVRAMIVVPPPPPPLPLPPPPPPPPPPPEKLQRREGLTLDEAEQELKRLRKQAGGKSMRVNLEWVVPEGGK